MENTIPNQNTNINAENNERPIPENKEVGHVNIACVAIVCTVVFLVIPVIFGGFIFSLFLKEGYKILTSNVDEGKDALIRLLDDLESSNDFDDFNNFDEFDSFNYFNDNDDSDGFFQQL